MRVNGVANQSSVKWDAQNLNMSFDITEGDKRLPVHFHGVMPDTFAQSESVVVEGALGANGVFEARTMLVKCPSRSSRSSILFVIPAWPEFRPAIRI